MTETPHVLRTDALSGRERYQLLTSLVVPRPIAWVATRSAAGEANLAPFSYFTALAASPMLIGISVGDRRGEPKDTLRNVRETGVFCVSIVSEPHLGPMNESGGDHPRGFDEFAHAGLVAGEGELVSAPYVRDAPATLECRLTKEVPLEGSPNTLLVGEVLGVRFAPGVAFEPGTCSVRTESLQPVARLWGDHYALIGEMPVLTRPGTDPPPGAEPRHERND